MVATAFLGRAVARAAPASASARPRPQCRRVRCAAKDAAWAPGNEVRAAPCVRRRVCRRCGRQGWPRGVVRRLAGGEGEEGRGARRARRGPRRFAAALRPIATPQLHSRLPARADRPHVVVAWGWVGIPCATAKEVVVGGAGSGVGRRARSRRRAHAGAALSRSRSRAPPPSALAACRVPRALTSPLISISPRARTVRLALAPRSLPGGPGWRLWFRVLFLCSCPPFASSFCALLLPAAVADSP